MSHSGKGSVPVIHIPDFWHRLQTSRRMFLALDYDGTLAPFQADRTKAYPLPGIPEILQSLAGSEIVSLAIVSGRPIAELLTLLPLQNLIRIGSHGFEQMRPDGEIVVSSPSPRQLKGLKMAGKMARGLGFDEQLEFKVASIALHTRIMPHEAAVQAEHRMYKLWAALGPIGLECRKFDGGIEIRATGRNKGDVLAELLAELTPDTFSVFTGDDDTDEDAFRAIRGRGIGIKVGKPDNFSAADGFLPDCEAVRNFLRQWLFIISGKKGK